VIGDGPVTIVLVPGVMSRFELAGPGHLSPAEQAGLAGFVVDFTRRPWPEQPGRPERRVAPTAISPAREAGT
jgi:hypothetical protein